MPLSSSTTLRHRRRAARPRRPGRVLIGTSGYVYADWRGRFYPHAVAAREWLPYYAARFPTVELNNSFYRLPGAATFAAWRAAAPDGFVFAVKASRFLTHLKRLKDPARPLRLFLTRARRLGPALGPVLFQLPPRFHANVPRLARFLSVLGRQRIVPGLRAVLEVRHESWLVPEVVARLRSANVALCFHDSRRQAVTPATAPVTADFVYVRRHGHGRRGSYTRRALAADAACIRGWQAEGRDVYVYFNNDWRALAVRNALTLAAMVATAAPVRPRAVGRRAALGRERDGCAGGLRQRIRAPGGVGASPAPHLHGYGKVRDGKESR